MSREILILAGGGGHTGYAYALAQTLVDEASLSFLVPEGDRLSEERLKKFGTVDFLIKPRGPKTPAHEFAVRLAKSGLKSFRKVSRKLNFVVSTGSNFCLSPALFGWLKGIPLVNIESSVRFTKASKTTRMLQPFSTITALHWEEQKKLLKDGVVVGPLLPQPDTQPRSGGYILVTGGTYGHKALFDMMAESELKNVVLQTGRVDPALYAKRHPEWRVIELSDKFHEIVAGADIVVTHFGSTILEALVYRKPTVVVPNPEWTRTAGIEDAKLLANKVNAVLVSVLDLPNLLNAIDEARFRETPVFPDGAKNLAGIMLKS